MRKDTGGRARASNGSVRNISAPFVLEGPIESSPALVERKKLSRERVRLRPPPPDPLPQKLGEGELRPGVAVVPPPPAFGGGGQGVGAGSRPGLRISASFLTLHQCWARTTIALLVTPTPAWAQPAKSQNPSAPFLILLLLPLALLVFTALQIVLWVLAPAPLSATCHTLERGRGRCLMIGLGAAIATLVLLSVLGQHPAVGKTVGPLLLGIVALGCLTGISAVAALLGRGALDLAGRTGSQALSVTAGSLLLGFVVLFPIVGQVLGVYFLLVGLGGAIGALAESRRTK
jgi:hypothetical protein